MKSILVATIAYPSFMIAPVLVVWLAARWFYRPSDRKRTEWMLVVATLAIPLCALAQATANSLSRLRPLTYDQYVYSFDRFLGQPSFVLGRLAQHHTAFIILVSVSYGLLTMALVGTFAAYLWLRPVHETLMVVKVFVLNLFAAVPIYLLFPVCGPAFAFHNFPFDQPAHLAPHMVACMAPPNGVPSVHASSAMLILWFLRRWRWGVITGSIFLVLMLISTLASGQHYAFDLICAIPYAIAVYWVANRWLHLPKASEAPCPETQTQSR